MPRRPQPPNPNSFKKSDAVAEIRQSQVVTNWGPGAIADLRGPMGSPISVLMAGLDEWGSLGLNHRQAIHEPRLEQDLNVRGFRLPPVGSDGLDNVNEGVDQRHKNDVLPVVRFPMWYQCQYADCARLRRLDAPEGGFRRAMDSKGNGTEEYHCHLCTQKRPKKMDGRPDHAWVVPARLIVACASGHVDEFPWRAWSGCKCVSDAVSDLRIEQRFAGLAGRYVRCATCQATNGGTSLDGAFSSRALPDVGYRSCRHLQPWLRAGPPQAPANGLPSVPCAPPRVLQRGASNVYWSCIESSLSIPPYSAIKADPLAIFGDSAGAIHVALDRIAAGTSTWSQEQPLFDALCRHTPGLDPQDAMKAIELANTIKSGRPVNTRDREGRKWEEFLAFDAARRDRLEDAEFSVIPSVQGDEVDVVLRDQIDAVLLATRLREVRAQTGFTRITPPTQPGDPSLLRRWPPKEYKDKWLPAAEIRGEGIMFVFREDAINRWEALDSVKQHHLEYLHRLQAMPPTFTAPENLAPRLLLLHSFSHALMRGLSLECGYSSASLAERIYAGPSPDHPDRRMAAVLVYTGSPDSGGTLGGLVRRGRREFIISTLRTVIQDARWCSTDPLCITGAASLAVPNNHAACHGCLLAPETSCEFPYFNGFLDRALLVGTPDQPELGFFKDVILRLDAEEI